MAKVLLDTDILSEYLKAHDRNVRWRAAEYVREQGIFTFTSVTVYEIVFGLQLKDAARQLQKALAWLDQNEQVTPTAGDYVEAAIIKATARRQGATLELAFPYRRCSCPPRPSVGHREYRGFSGDPKDRHRPAT